MARPFQDGVPGGMFGEATTVCAAHLEAFAASTEGFGAIISFGWGAVCQAPLSFDLVKPESRVLD